MALTRLKQLREEAVLTVHELAEASGVSDDTISKIENGQRVARPNTLRKLASALGVSPQELRRPAKTEELAGAGKATAPSEAGLANTERTHILEGFAAAVGSVVDRTQRMLEQIDNTNGDALVTLFEETFVAQMGAERILEQVDEEATQIETPEARRARVELEHAVLRLTDLFENLIDELGLEERPAVVVHLAEERLRRRAG